MIPFMYLLISLFIVFYFGAWIIDQLWHTTETSTCQYEIWEREDEKQAQKERRIQFYKERYGV